MKYVMFEVEGPPQSGLNHRVPIIFPNHLVHADIAAALGELVKKTYAGASVKVVSAGDASVSTMCSGKSDTLKVASLGSEDSQTINAYDYFHGLVDKEGEDDGTGTTAGK